MRTRFKVKFVDITETKISCHAQIVCRMSCSWGNWYHWTGAAPWSSTRISQKV